MITQSDWDSVMWESGQNASSKSPFHCHKALSDLGALVLQKQSSAVAGGRPVFSWQGLGGGGSRVEYEGRGLKFLSGSKHTPVCHALEAAMSYLTVDPAILLMIVGVLMFLITFCGCVGSLHGQSTTTARHYENLRLSTFSICLTIIFILQLAAGILGFVFSDKSHDSCTAACMTVVASPGPGRQRQGGQQTKDLNRRFTVESETTGES
ncbi:hypothetical protein JZ751_005807 [Albula glossodonta]|uniref:Uncharacterized protein n=1 Tax=Albula glossodonta TaxID=121402 RepID=A0A8T2P4Z3_9TELE|nr:hypothetical protein JZ751_005807 [Albula glossodonta]